MTPHVWRTNLWQQWKFFFPNNIKLGPVTIFAQFLMSMPFKCITESLQFLFLAPILPKGRERENTNNLSMLELPCSWKETNNSFGMFSNQLQMLSRIIQLKNYRLALGYRIRVPHNSHIFQGHKDELQTGPTQLIISAQNPRMNYGLNTEEHGFYQHFAALRYISTYY